MADRKAVYHIKEGKDGKSFWTKIGVAFVNKDGSINAILEALPVDGKLHIRDEKKREQRQDSPPNEYDQTGGDDAPFGG